MRKLGLSEEEIQQVLADDKAIDRGEKLFELSVEQKQASKQSRQVSRAPGVYNFEKKRVKTPNEAKAHLINLLIAGLGSNVCDIEVINTEREFTFTHNEIKYKIVLSAPRK